MKFQIWTPKLQILAKTIQLAKITVGKRYQLASAVSLDTISQAEETYHHTDYLQATKPLNS